MLRANLFCIAKKKVMETQYPFDTTNIFYLINWIANCTSDKSRTQKLFCNPVPTDKGQSSIEGGCMLEVSAFDEVG